MFGSRQGLTAAALAILGLVASSCSCGDGGHSALAPVFVLEGDAVSLHEDPDNGGSYYVIDFGTVTVGSRFTPEVYVFNDGNADLTVKVENAGDIGEPFALASADFSLRPKTRRPLEFTIHPRSEGIFEEMVTFTTNESDRTKKVRLVGRATQSQFVCDPLHLDIGHVVVGESRSRVVNCTNNLDIPTTVTLGEFAGSYRAYFSAELQGIGDGRQAEIPAGGSVDIEVEFSADNIVEVATVTLPIYDPSGDPIVNIVVTATAVDYALQVLAENAEGERVPLTGCYSFPDTDIEEESIRSLWVRNVSRNPVQIVGASLDASASEHFTYLGPSFDEPKTVAPDGEEEVEIPIAFNPKVATLHQTNLVIQGSGTRAAPLHGLHACIQGQGGGARISCMPSEIQFGPVAIGTSVTQSYKCTNTAIIREDAPQILTVSSVESSDPSRFTAQIRNLDGTIVTGAASYYPGEEFWVDVTYEPIGPEESFDSAIITIYNDSSATPEHKTSVSGQARDLPPCVFEIAPSNIRFGVVPPGQQRTLSAYVINQAEHECILSQIRLSEDSDPAFHMEPIGTVILPPKPTDPEDESLDYRYPIEVTFAPSEYGDAFAGAVEFTISDPANQNQRIPLTGIAQRPCLDLDPVEIDFGAAPPMCAGREVRVYVANTCTEDLRIDDISIVDSSLDAEFPQFVLLEVGRTPFELLSGDRIEFAVYFRPDGLGEIRGQIEIDVSVEKNGQMEDAGPYVISLMGRGQYDAIQTDSYTQNERPKVDVLWVIDNSGSMSDEQALIQNHIPNFMKFAIEQNIDFHIGVTTTGTLLHGLSACAETGFSENEDGRLVPHPSLNRPRILKSSMPKDVLESVFAQNVKVGTCHAYEAVYEAAKRALSDPWINTPEAEGGNQGFLRRDASLSIIGVTDEPDSDSPDPVADYIEFFRSLKPSRMEKSVKVHFISGGYTTCSSNMGSASACPRCVQGTEMTDGVFVEICMDSNDPRWEEAFLEMSEGAFGFDTSFRLRGQPGDSNGDGILTEDDIEVRVGGRPRPPISSTGARIWRYNYDNNSIAFSPLYVPGANQLIEVTYTVACVEH